MKCLLLILSLMAASVYGQEFKVMFYNVENFFDINDDPQTNDETFTPSGANQWNMRRFIVKRNNIYKTIVAAGKGHPPHIIGLCEVENRYVLYQLTQHTPLSKYNYGIVHYDSPDSRGIDVALLYMKDSFSVIASRAYKAPIRTRDILYVKGTTRNDDTLHFFVNHWPSKWGGAASEDLRILVGKTLKHLTDSILDLNPKANICIMGDFNDYPDSKAVGVLDARPLHADKGARLYNMSLHLQDEHRGTLKYQNRWEMIDLFFVSGNMLSSDNGLHCTKNSIEIFDAVFLLTTVSGEGKSPFRTYRGPVYVGGFSDHLPVILRFSIKR